MTSLEVIKHKLYGGGGWTNRTAASFLEASFCESFCRRPSDLLYFADAKSRATGLNQSAGKIKGPT
jgi:hypothetical protein